MLVFSHLFLFQILFSLDIFTTADIHRQNLLSILVSKEIGLLLFSMITSVS
jgi:hypothetical protein